MRRAMTDVAKAEKAKLILNVAYDLYKNSTFEDIKMIDIAKAANVSKGTMFFYYSTKEILFMEILFLEYEKRFKGFEELLLPLGKMTYEEFKVFFLQEMAGILDEKSVFIRLSAIKSTILERNIDYETTVKVSLGMFTSLERIVRLLVERVAGFTEDDFYELFQAQHAIIVGFKNVVSMPEAMSQVIIDQKIERYRVEFKSHALIAMEYYLEGWNDRQRK
ncbi:TetR family transcriptional regulator [Paenibacillus senegalimassiliensis]|uniref:TetR family transcriptional regulator n=1 Tax=Paenibacillus senegalimassiliensis TaxID=1737426 RepID=UPI00073E5DA7|nr:TetR family transcriptional regulator [Paenibacillus senegalimassiliensis]